MTKKEIVKMAKTKAIIIILALLSLSFGLSANSAGKAKITAITVSSDASDASQDTPSDSTPPNPLPNFTPPALKITPKKINLGDTLFNASLFSLAALNFGDYISTRQALKYPGLQEGNPIMKPFVKNDILFTGVKLGITLADYFLIKRIYKKNKVMGWVISVAANIAMGYIVSNNVRMIQSVKGN
jgi:hypothetical protein